MNIIKLSIHLCCYLLIKKELPSERILMATLGDDGDKNIYMYTMKIFHNCQYFLFFFHKFFDFYLL